MTDSRQLLRTLTRTWLPFALQASSKNKPAIKVDLLAAPHGIPVLKHPLFVSVHYLFNPKNVFLCIPTVYGKKKKLQLLQPYHQPSHCLSLLISKQAMSQAVERLAILWRDPHQQATDDNHTVCWLQRIINLLMVIRRKYKSVCGKQSLLNN